MLSFAKSLFSVGALAAAFTLVSSEEAEAKFGLGIRLGHVRSTLPVAPRTTYVYGTHYPVNQVSVGVVTPPIVTRRIPTYTYPTPVIRPGVPYVVRPSSYGYGWYY